MIASMSKFSQNLMFANISQNICSNYSTFHLNGTNENTNETVVICLTCKNEMAIIHTIFLD